MAGPATDGNGKIVKKREEPELVSQLESMRTEIARALPRHITADRMARIVLTALRTNRELMQSDRMSFVACVMQASQLGLEVNSPLGLAYLIPRKKNGRVYTTLQLGYQGMLELARRSGQIASIDADVVYDSDHFVYRKGDDPKIEHEPRGEDDPRKIVFAYAIARLKDGGIQRTVLTRKKIEKARSAAASSSGPWSTHYDEMAKKTAIRALYKLLPKSAEMAIAAAVDEAPELGLTQTAAMDIDVRGAIERQGFEGPSEMEALPEGPPDDEPEDAEIEP